MIGERPFVFISVGVCYPITTFTIKSNQSNSIKTNKSNL